jgi:hypothetical protein
MPIIWSFIVTKLDTTHWFTTRKKAKIRWVGMMSDEDTSTTSHVFSEKYVVVDIIVHVDIFISSTHHVLVPYQLSHVSFCQEGGGHRKSENQTKNQIIHWLYS